MKLKFLKSPSPHLAFSKADEEVDGCPHALKRLYVSVKCKENTSLLFEKKPLFYSKINYDYGLNAFTT